MHVPASPAQVELTEPSQNLTSLIQEKNRSDLGLHLETNNLRVAACLAVPHRTNCLHRCMCLSSKLQNNDSYDTLGAGPTCTIRYPRRLIAYQQS